MYIPKFELMKNLKIAFILSCLFFVINGNNYAQQCSCKAFAALIAEQEKGDEFSVQAINQLATSSNKLCIAKSNEWKAKNYSNEQNYDTAEIYFRLAEQLYKQSGCNDSVLLSTYEYWAELYYTKGDFAKALDISFKMLQSAEAAKNYYKQALCNTMISQLLNQTGQAARGIDYARKAIPFIEKIEFPSKKADILFKISKRFLWHYQDTKSISSLDSSELFSLQQLAIARSIKRNSSIAAALSNLEGVSYERKDFKKALQYQDSSFGYINKDDEGSLAMYYYDKADILIELGKYKEAAVLADTSLSLYKRTGSTAYISEGYALVSKIARLNGDYKKAFEATELSHAINDSIKDVEKISEVAELEKKYNQAKNEKTIKELDQQKRIYLLLTIAALLAVVAIVFYLRQQSLKHKQTILETEQRLNRARMNPHFFFNALASLQSFAMRENDGKALASNLSKFSHIMRETLESSYKEYVTVEQEIDFLNEYLELQKIRFPKKFSFEVNADKNLEIDDLMIPSMILQPFVENSIEHGFAGIDYPGHVAVAFSKNEKEIVIHVNDNGLGLNYGAKNNHEHISRASQIIKDRIYLLNIKLKTKARFNIDNNENGGVDVKIYLPLLYKENV